MPFLDSITLGSAISWDAVNGFAKAVISIFAIVNPICNLPIFISLTEDASIAERRRVFRLATATALAIVCIMAVAGDFLLTQIFGIGFDEFRFGGGLLLIVMGVVRIVRPVSRPPFNLDPRGRESDQLRLAISPIASPLLVGPGSIVTVMLISKNAATQLGGVLYAIGASVLCFAVVFVVLNWSHVLFRLIGKIGTLAVGRVMDIFIVAIGVHFIFTSLRQAFGLKLGM